MSEEFETLPKIQCVISQAQPLAITKAVSVRTHDGEAAHPTQDLVNSRCITVYERSCSQGLRNSWLAMLLCIA